MASGAVSDKGQLNTNNQYDRRTDLTSIVKDIKNNLSSNSNHNLRIGDNSKDNSLGLNALNISDKISAQVNPMAVTDYINAQLGNLGLNVNQIV